MTGYSLEYTPSHRALIRAIPQMQKRLRLSGWQVSVAMFFVAGVLMFIVTGVDRWLNGRTPFALVGPLGAIAALVIAFLVIRPFAQAYMACRMDQLSPPTLTRLEATDECLQISDDLVYLRFDWRSVHGAAASADGVLILHMGYAGSLVPMSAFRSTVESDAFIEFVNARADRSAV